MKRDGVIVVRTPVRTSKKEIRQFLDKKRGWLNKRILEQKTKEWECREKSFTTGEEFLFLGSKYPLQITHGDGLAGHDGPLIFSNNQFVLQSDFIFQGRALFKAWYRRKARQYFAERTQYYRMILPAFPAEIRISHAQSRWGSCSPEDRIFVSWRLIMAPPPVIDYVLLHEFVHTIEKGHSRRFWDLLESILPDHRKRRLWLREHGHLLAF